MPSISNSSETEDCLLLIRNNGPTPDAAMSYINRLLQRNQSGHVKFDEYRLLKSRILSNMSLPKNCGARPVGSTAVMTAVATDTDAGDETQAW
jgi:hypothetical protein